MATFEETWRKVRLAVPDAPVFLVRQWVQTAVNTLWDRRGWTWAVEQGQLISQPARNNLAVTVAQGSTTVTSAALFTAADIGRQFRVENYPVYTIVSLTDASTIELDLAYEGTANGATEGQILDAYATLPANFSRFVIVVSPILQRIVPWWATQEELDFIDPTRQFSDTEGPRLLVARAMSPVPGFEDCLQYEYWPYPAAHQALQYYMISRPPELADSYRFKGVLAHRTDILQKGALAEAAKWPGTRERPNPYFNVALARQLSGEFDALCTQLDLRDDDQNQQSISQIPWQKWSSYAWAYNTQLLQSTDATLNDYAGYLGGYGSGY